MLEGQWHCNHVLYQFEWVHNVKQCVQKVFKLAFKDLCLYSGVVCPCFQSDSLVLRAWWCHSSAFTTAQLKEKGMAMPCKALWMIFLGLQLQQQWSPLCSRHRRVFTTSSHWSSPNCWCWLSKLQEFTLTDNKHTLDHQQTQLRLARLAMIYCSILHWGHPFNRWKVTVNVMICKEARNIKIHCLLVIHLHQTDCNLVQPSCISPHTKHTKMGCLRFTLLKQAKDHCFCD